MNEFITIFDKTKKGRNHYNIEDCGIRQKDISSYIPKELIRYSNIDIPEISENEVIRHYTNLAAKNYGIDNGIYPLGSCTMKYNPKINEYISKLPEFIRMHPYQSIDDIQGSLMIYYELGELLKEIIGFDGITFQPSAGAHGELCGLLMIKKYFLSKQDERNIIVIPDSAHGTNFASASMAGFRVLEIKSNANGIIDISELEKIVKEKTNLIAAMMITNPNTLGIFEKDIIEIAKIIHQNGAFLYYDGANLNAIIGQVKPEDMGFDLVHINLHKTFSAPHGGGGPGSGPVLVNKKLIDFLPFPTICKKGSKYFLDYEIKYSIGKMRSFFGNFSVCLKAYCYLLAFGDRLKDISIDAVLNSNYLKKRLSKCFDIPYSKNCMHEFVISTKKYKDKGGTALNIAKRLIDYGIHPPTIYFPHIFEEAMMFEPTETESLNNLDYLAGILEDIIKEVKKSSKNIVNAPISGKINRINELQALKEPILKHQ